MHCTNENKIIIFYGRFTKNKTRINEIINLISNEIMFLLIPNITLEIIDNRDIKYTMFILNVCL